MTFNHSQFTNEDLQHERMSLLGVILSSAAYGANAVLFLSCLTHGFKRGRWLGIYLCALSLLATAGIVMQILWHLFTFYEGIQLSQSPMQFAQDNVNHPIHLSVTWIYVIMGWLAEGMLLYRFTVIYSMNPSRLVHFIVRGVAGAALLTLIIIGGIYIPQLTLLGTYPFGDIPSSSGITWMFLTSAIHAVFSSLSIGKILSVRRLIVRVLKDSGKEYTSIAALLTESALLYTCWLLASGVGCIVNSPVQFVFIPPIGQIQAIPAVLIIYRVVCGKAISNEAASTVRFTSAGPPTRRLKPLEAHSQTLLNPLIPDDYGGEEKFFCSQPQFMGDSEAGTSIDSPEDIARLIPSPAKARVHEIPSSPTTSPLSSVSFVFELNSIAPLRANSSYEHPIFCVDKSSLIVRSSLSQV